MTVKLLTEQYLEFLSLKGGCTGSYESTLVKMPHCWKSHVMAHLLDILIHGNLIIFEESSSLVLNGVIWPHWNKYLQMTIILWNKYQPTTIISPQDKTLGLIMGSLVNSLDDNKNST